MKKTIKIILIILTTLLTILLSYNYLIFNNSILMTLFILSLLSSVLTQLFCLNDFHFVKRILFILLNLILSFLTSIIAFLITGNVFPYSTEYNINLFTFNIGFLLLISNFTFFYTILTLFINKFKENEKSKSKFAKLILIYFCAITIFEILVLTICNK